MEDKRKWFIPVVIAAVLLIVTAIIIVFTFSGMQNKRLNKLEFESKNISVYNITKDKEVFNLEENKQVPPASLTKIMTVITAIENIEDTDKVAPIDKVTYQKMVADNASMAGFYGNEPTTYKDLLYGTMLASGGECANSLAINISGNIENFVTLMNKKVKSLELENTNFKNPEGMDENENYSSAKDIASIIKSSLSNKVFKEVFTSGEYVSTPTLDHPEGVVIKSTIFEALEGYEQDGFKILGGKSGTTIGAGYCWATLIEKDGEEYICVVMGSENEEGRILDTIKIAEEL